MFILLKKYNQIKQELGSKVEKLEERNAEQIKLIDTLNGEVYSLKELEKYQSIVNVEERCKLLIDQARKNAQAIRKKAQQEAEQILQEAKAKSLEVSDKKEKTKTKKKTKPKKEKVTYKCFSCENEVSKGVKKCKFCGAEGPCSTSTGICFDCSADVCYGAKKCHECDIPYPDTKIADTHACFYCHELNARYPKKCFHCEVEYPSTPPSHIHPCKKCGSEVAEDAKKCECGARNPADVNIY